MVDLRQAIDEVNKHLPGMHDQLTHGHPGIHPGLTPEQYAHAAGVPVEFASAINPDTIPVGTRITTELGRTGLSTGRSTTNPKRAAGLVDALQKIYPANQYFLHKVGDRYHVVQEGNGPVGTVIRQEHFTEVLGKKPPEHKPDVGGRRRHEGIRQVLRRELGLKKPAADYVGPSGKFVNDGNSIMQEAYGKMMTDSHISIEFSHQHPAFQEACTRLGIKEVTENATPYNGVVYKSYKATFAQTLALSKEMPQVHSLKEKMRELLAEKAVEIAGENATFKEHFNADAMTLFRTADVHSFQTVASFDKTQSWQVAAAYINNHINSDAPAVPVKAFDEARAEADDSREIHLNMGDSRAGQVLLHEYGHWLEAHDSEVKQAALDFLFTRVKPNTRTIPLRRMRGDGGGKGMGKNEYAFKDKFITPYVGKDYYGTATEVTSVGLEYVFKNPTYVMVTDPDHFAYILGVTRRKKQ